MDKQNHSLKIEAGRYKAAATGWGLAVLLAIVALIVFARFYGWS